MCPFPQARNAEKAMTALARFRQAQLAEGKVKERRPFLASECSELPKAEKWRRQIISEISKKVAQIQNAGLGEFKIRDLNDEINKLLREKGHWEVRIKELGGPDYAVNKHTCINVLYPVRLFSNLCIQIIYLCLPSDYFIIYSVK
uniref:Pre-mRNA-splicing factor ISY1 homolog n=1 Tax=Cyclopterus lumpus TaxID=8103 RepID=A0A8C2WP66_CYCLU